MKEEFGFILDNFKIIARRMVEQKERLEKLIQSSTEYKIQFEVLNNMGKELNKFGELVYSAIISYNADPMEFTIIGRSDILEAQLVQDEVTSFLKEHNINMNYIHPRDLK